MAAKNRNLFRVTRLLILNLPKFFKFFSRFRTPSKRLLIIKTDAIGDYILFRNFLEIVKSSPLYSGYRIDLLGNLLWQDIALKYDSGYVNEFIFINAEALNDAPLKVFKLAYRLFVNNYEAVLQPTYSRTFITDGLAAFTAAKQITGFEGDTERIPLKYKTKTDKFYTQLLKLPDDAFFEFDRFVFFFKSVLKQPISILAPFISVEKTSPGGIVIFPGSGVLKRSWEPGKFLDLLKLLLANTSKFIYLAGGPSETELCRYLADNLPRGRIYNLAGKTSLSELITLIGNADLVISNETSAVHIAAATKTKSICLLGGGHFGRFAPYPGRAENNPLCVYEKMDCYNCNWNCKFAYEEGVAFPCVSAISVARVWQHAAQLLSANRL
jgi:ADP-heptose:LPS heptosyltransferase